jgi:hypothetical protein
MNGAGRADVWLPGPARALDAFATAPATAESADELIERVARRLDRAGIVANLAGIIDTFIAVGFVLTAVVGDRLRTEVRELDFGIGVSGGVAVAGNIGAEERFEYTVIGDPVNEAARVCELAKERPERVLASGRALAVAGEAEAAGWQVEEAVVVRGRGQETELATPASVPADATSIVAPADGG